MVKQYPSDLLEFLWLLSFKLSLGIKKILYILIGLKTWL